MNNAEIDAAVAEMMGYRAWKEKRGEFALCFVTKPGAEKPWMSSKVPKPERYTPCSCAEALKIGFFVDGIPKFSTDMNRAMEVVEKLKTHHMIWERRPFGKWLVVIRPPQPKDVHAVQFEVVEESLPLAICLAAIRAVGVEVEELQ